MVQAIETTPHVLYDKGGPRVLIGLSTEIKKGYVAKPPDNISTWKTFVHSIERRQVDSNPENCGWVIKEDPTVRIHQSAFLGKDVVVVGSNVTIGKNAKIDGKVIIYNNVVIGEDTVFTPNKQVDLENQYKMTNAQEKQMFLMRADVEKGSLLKCAEIRT